MEEPDPTPDHSWACRPLTVGELRFLMVSLRRRIPTRFEQCVAGVGTYGLGGAALAHVFMPGVPWWEIAAGIVYVSAVAAAEWIRHERQRGDYDHEPPA